MNVFQRRGGHPLRVAFFAAMAATAVHAQDFSQLGISDLVGVTDRMLQRGDYKSAIPALIEVVSRTAELNDEAGRKTAQNARFELARSYFQTGSAAEGIKVLEEYMANEPRDRERQALRMLAQGFFEVQEWAKIQETATRLLKFPDLTDEDRFIGNLMLGQSYFQEEKWAESVPPLEFAALHAKEDRIERACQLMLVRALVESENWGKLFGWVQRVYRTDAKYDISLNLTLMKAGKAQFEKGDEEHKNEYLNALLLYRMVLPREELLKHSGTRQKSLSQKLADDTQRGIPQTEIDERQKEIDALNESMDTLRGLPPYEQEVSFRIGQIYAEVKRFWEGFVIFDELFKEDATGEIGETSLLQSVLVLYDLQQYDRAEQRVVNYLDERPNGRFARTLLSLMIRDNLNRKQYGRIAEFQKYVDELPPTDDADERSAEADIHYMSGFSFFLNRDYPSAGAQFKKILDDFPESDYVPNSTYFLGMAFLMQGEYAKALPFFQTYQERYGEGEQFASAMFREAISLFGAGGLETDKEKAAEMVRQSEAIFTKFIDTFPDEDLVSEAYSMRGDIEAAKESTNDDPYPLDRAVKDYRKGIDTAKTQFQASYAAFQAAKVYQLETKWQEIIDLMKYYMNRWEDQADVAQAVYWIGQSQIELEQVQQAVEAYVDAIERFGNEPAQFGVDKIIGELVKVAATHLSPGDREGLAIQLKLKLANVAESMPVLKLRYQVAQAMLEGDEAAAALGAALLSQEIPLEVTSPSSLALMCDAAVSTGNAAEMKRLSDYFIEHFEESELLWHAYRARAYKLQAENDNWGVLAAVDEAQGLFGVEPHMGWAQLLKAETLYRMEKYEEAEEAYNTMMGVPQWRGPLFAEAYYGMGKCRLGRQDLEGAHAFFQRIYLLFAAYSDGDWAAKGYLAAADCLVKLGREQDAIKTLQDMLENPYTKTNPLAEKVRDQLKKLGVQ